MVKLIFIICAVRVTKSRDMTLSKLLRIKTRKEEIAYYEEYGMSSVSAFAREINSVLSNQNHEDFELLMFELENFRENRESEIVWKRNIDWMLDKNYINLPHLVESECPKLYNEFAKKNMLISQITHDEPSKDKWYEWFSS